MENKSTKGLTELKKKFKDKLDIHVFNTNDPVRLKWYYSPTRFPKLLIKRNNVEYQLDVQILSSEEEDKRLLHHLLVKTREQN